MKEIVYHGTDAQFDNFDIDFINYHNYSELGLGFYFDTEEENAVEYGTNLIKAEITYNNPFIISKKTYNMMAKCWEFPESDNFEVEDFIALMEDNKESKTFWIQAHGYDAIIWDTQRIVFKPEQIKILEQKEISLTESADNHTSVIEKPLENSNFKAWFKNSQVVDSEGNPLIVYHGTPDVFDTFKKSEIGSETDGGLIGRGFYFHIDPDTAKVYGKNVMPCYLSIQKMYDFNNGKSINDNIRAMGIDPELDNYYDSAEVREARVAGKVTQWLKDNGYDGARVWGQYMVLEPEQIKSVENNGNWGKTSNIYERLNEELLKLI